MDVGSAIRNIAVSRDGKVLVSGTKSGRVTVWDTERHSKATEFKAHDDWVRAIDVSPDARKIVTGSDDETACVWSLSTGERLLGPLKHIYWVVAAKFSPDGHFIATATSNRDSVRVYDSEDGNLLVDFPVKVNSASNHSLAWASDSKQLVALSHDGDIFRVNASTGITLSKWHIHSWNDPTCIALASNGTFIAASARSSVSFWDATSQEQIGIAIKYTHNVGSMAMSSNNDLVTGGDKRITLRALCSTLPSHYIDDVSVPALGKLSIANHIHSLLQTLRMPEIQQEVEKVDDCPSKFISILISISDTHVHQTKEQQISREPSRNCVSSSPNLNNKPVRRGIASPSRYALKRKARVCPPLHRRIYPPFTATR